MTRQIPIFGLGAFPRLHECPLIVDYFAGGGGVSEGIARALGRAPDVAVNHCAHAVAMHATNHPTTRHLHVDVWDVDPERDLPPGEIGLLWASPDCKHFSRAKGGKPVEKKIRGLAWVVVRVAKRRRPAVIVLENVQEFRTWGPVGVDGQPIKAKAGLTYRRFLGRLRALGYVVEDRVLDAADFGAPTHRRRLILVARRDGEPIAWPAPTHGPGRANAFRSAAECIDWAIPCPSIFERARPLAEATQRRIAEGVRRFVLANPRPFIVQVNHGRDVNRSRDPERPMPTITATHGFGLVAPCLVQTGQGERPGQTPRCRTVERPYPTAVAGGAKQGLVAAFLQKHNKRAVGQRVDDPCHTLVGTRNKSVVEVSLSRDQLERGGRVAAFLTKYYGEAGKRVTGGQRVDAPLHTITTMPRFGLVTVTIDGDEYAIVDIGLRMLSPRELARCQGFPDSYVLTGTQAQQVARIGNSVPPQLAEAVVRANVRRDVAEAAE